jgi:hypothetical protein
MHIPLNLKTAFQDMPPIFSPKSEEIYEISDMTSLFDRIIKMAS